MIKTSILLLMMVSMWLPGYAGISEHDYVYAQDKHEAVMVDKLSALTSWIYNPETSSNGTGVLLSFSDNKEFVFAVTNYHVVSSSAGVPAKGVVVYLNDSAGKGAKPVWGYYWYGDRERDIALIRLGYIEGIEFPIFPNNKFVDKKDVAHYEDIARGRGVCFLGFPFNFGVKLRGKLTVKSPEGYKSVVPSPAQKTPVVRYGKIAYTDDDSFFVLDAHASPGNSGSPIFVRSEEEQFRNGFEKYVPTYKLAGIVSAFKKDKVVSDDGKDVGLFYNSGLVIGVKIRAILDCYAEGLKKNSLRE